VPLAIMVLSQRDRVGLNQNCEKNHR
jgi:hypothetical protein